MCENDMQAQYSKFFEMCNSKDEKDELTPEIIENIIPVLCDIDVSNETQLNLQTNIFKALRNACGLHPISPFNIYKCSKLLKLSVEQLVNHASVKSENDELKKCIHFGLQFLGNFVSKVPDAKMFIYKLMNCSFMLFLSHDDEKLRSYFCFVLYNCLTNESLKDLIETKCDVIDKLLNLYACDDVDWIFLIIEKLLQDDDFLALNFSNLSDKAKLVIIDFIIEQLEDDNLISLDHLKFLSEVLNKNLKNIVSFAYLNDSNKDSLEPLVTQRLLLLICKASALPAYEVVVSLPLLETSISTLKQIHDLSKSGKANMDVVNTLEKKLKIEDLECEPLFGFKRDLIRLIGNFCSGRPDFQNRARECEAIALILDCSQIDARNPYIQQWCIFSIRNLLDNNPENKAYLANISVTGTLKDSPLLRELGLAHLVEK